MKEQVIAGMLTLSLALGFIFSIEVLAQNNRTLLDPCVSDLQKYCQNAEPGGGAFLTCLDENKDKLSPECRARNKKLHEMVVELQGACNNDLLKFCDDVSAGGGRMIKCLRDHTTELSNACKVGIDNSLQNRKNLLQSQWP
ncbi:cysteine rich repeat-containing protein [Bdellovibrio bacteriovorus]|uniref:Cysteine rich repeat domain protein n=1 Tax=Bdellovibrio bacteriovorus TaxID=959 RepID=A0A150WW57_BDEBC|nr:cysteine rich repeat-containing protein [Bdellovibrio bacteriovorus]KYG70701.1 hypothetical protein AZI85_01860 [Bdellovibrio bacteriovorus]